jgi:hypothetical protein
MSQWLQATRKEAKRERESTKNKDGKGQTSKGYDQKRKGEDSNAGCKEDRDA